MIYIRQKICHTPEYHSSAVGTYCIRMYSSNAAVVCVSYISYDYHIIYDMIRILHFGPIHCYISYDTQLKRNDVLFTWSVVVVCKVSVKNQHSVRSTLLLYTYNNTTHICRIHAHNFQQSCPAAGDEVLPEGGWGFMDSAGTSQRLRGPTFERHPCLPAPARPAFAAAFAAAAVFGCNGAAGRCCCCTRQS